MSYFIMTAGSEIDISDLPPAELIPASKAQYYISGLAQELEAADGKPLFLVHDGHSGTSDELIPEEYGLAPEERDQGVFFFKIITRLAQSGNTVRIWLAGNDPKAHQSVENHATAEGFVKAVKERFDAHRNINLRFGP
jgi:hypothetical protein